MKSNKEILSSILKTTQMGQIGIRSVMDYAANQNFKKALKSQLREYDEIEREAHAIAAARGWDVAELDPAIKFMSKAYARTNLRISGSDSKIAGMMIQGNTRGMIKGKKNQHHSCRQDPRVAQLSQKLIDCETENIKQMQGYL